MNEKSIYECWKAGELDRFESMGILKNHIVFYCRIYEEYYIHRKAGCNFMTAVEATAEKMNTSPDTVRRAVGTVV